MRRESLEVAPGRRISVLVWGRGPAQLVLVHGGAQNAHTWDWVALLLCRPLIAVDLAGHGHSDWRPDRDYSPRAHGTDLAPVVHRLAPRASAVGMSTGDLAGVALASAHPALVRRLVMVDITPGSRATRAGAILRFVHDAPRPATFEQLVDYAVARLRGSDPVASGAASFTTPGRARTGPGPSGTTWEASTRTRCSASRRPSLPCGRAWRARGRP